jgi:lysophospholipase L1-like esterase
MNHTARTFVFVALTVSILLALHFLPRISIGDTELRRVSVLSDILPDLYDAEDVIDPIPQLPDVPQPIIVADPQQGTPVAVQQAATQSSSTSAATPVTQSDSVATTASPAAIAQAEATAIADTTATAVVAPAPSQPQDQSVTPILDYSGGQAGGMYHFYQALSRSRQLGRPVRVAYYGDSFIEGDIFTADLRELLQDQFGGNGVGWVDCASQVHGFRTTVGHNFSGINEYEVVKRPFSASNQGIAQRYFTASEGARINYKGAKVRRHLAQWDRAVFYLRSDGGLRLRTTLNGDTTVVDTVSGAPRLQAIVRNAGYAPGDSLQRQRSMSSVSYSIQGISSGTLLYGVALEGVSGVSVDNFSMRGSAGYTIGQIPQATLQQFAALRPYDLIVIHFGLNVANSKQSNYSGYTKNMAQAINNLRQAFPQTSILVVGMPDRDQRSQSGLHTMKGVEQLVAYQQIMASDCRVSFFNLFQAMGGRDSMKGLVERGMANKDYTHINFKGGRYLARFLYDALMAGYHSYGF